MKVKFARFTELSLIERIRGWVYGPTFAFTLLFNGLCLSGLLNPIITIAIVVILLLLTVVFVPRILFEKQLTLFNSVQRKKLFKVLQEVGVVSIYFSVAIMIVQSTIFSNHFLFSILVDVLLFFPLIKVYHSEKKSRVIARDLANSLKKTRFLQRYQYLIKKAARNSKSFV